MARYSHSKINTFEQCRYKYKLKYIDWIKPDIPTTIEAFMGDLVHRALERLYRMRGTIYGPSKKVLLEFYNSTWEREYTEDILIVKKNMTSEDYRKLGEKFLSDYYEKHHPFNQLRVLGLETRDFLKLPDGNEWHVRMDMFAKDGYGNYYVIDHKTNSRMKTQWEADIDEQLAMYSLWVKHKFPNAKSIKLVWNMLAHNRLVISEPTGDRLRRLLEETMVKISRIEHTKKFPANITTLCNYCEYQNMCEYFQKAKNEGKI